MKKAIAISMDDIFLNSSLVTPLYKALKALLLKFAALILPSAQVVGDSLGFFQLTSMANHIFSLRAYKKAFTRTLHYT